MPDRIPAGAIDLADVKRRADERDAALAEVQRKQDDQQLLAAASSWDKSMTRAFKGILSAPERRRFLQRAVNAD
jgi:hypothetical protein